MVYLLQYRNICFNSFIVVKKLLRDFILIFINILEGFTPAYINKALKGLPVRSSFYVSMFL